MLSTTKSTQARGNGSTVPWARSRRVFLRGNSEMYWNRLDSRTLIACDLLNLVVSTVSAYCRIHDDSPDDQAGTREGNPSHKRIDRYLPIYLAGSEAFAHRELDTDWGRRRRRLEKTERGIASGEQRFASASRNSLRPRRVPHVSRLSRHGAFPSRRQSLTARYAAEFTATDRSDLKPARRSSERSCGCSNAAKCPPWSCFL